MSLCGQDGNVAGIAFTGVPSRAELESSPGFTPGRWLLEGPRAVIECVEEIPCNPCETACPRGAITVGEPITNLPRIDPSRCTGCGSCVPACPGQAVFIVDMSKEKQAFVSFPWEYLPGPVAGERATACDREGRQVCEATIVRVVSLPGHDRTRVVTISVPKEHAHTVRGIRRETVPQEDTLGMSRRIPRPGFPRETGDSEIICRCEEVTRAEVKQAIREGATTLSAVRRRTRAGMGLCQGRTCRRLVAKELERETGRSPTLIGRETARPPVMPVSLSVLAGNDGERSDR